MMIRKFNSVKQETKLDRIRGPIWDVGKKHPTHSIAGFNKDGRMVSYETIRIRMFMN